MRMECAYCSDVSECSCPDGLLHRHPEARHVCPVCIELLGMGVEEGELKTSPRRWEAESLVESEEFGAALAAMMVGEQFDGIWNAGKEELKMLSRKELAQEAYFQGIKAGIMVIAEAHKRSDLDEMLGEFRKGLETSSRKKEPC